jgi:hypothetical protein
VVYDRVGRVYLEHWKKFRSESLTLGLFAHRFNAPNVFCWNIGIVHGLVKESRRKDFFNFGWNESASNKGLFYMKNSVPPLLGHVHLQSSHQKVPIGSGVIEPGSLAFESLIGCERLQRLEAMLFMLRGPIPRMVFNEGAVAVTQERLEQKLGLVESLPESLELGLWNCMQGVS